MFKKVTVLLLALLLAISFTGCESQKSKEEKERQNKYLATYQAILDTNDKDKASDNFAIQLVVNKLSDSSYRYDVIIDQPKVAMYNIVAMAVIDDITSKVNTDEMMPTIGILDDNIYHMIPYQVDTKNGYVEGLILSLISNRAELRVGVMVDFTNKENTKHVRQYISLFTAYSEGTNE